MCLFTKFFHFLLYLFFYALLNCFYSTFSSFPLSLTSCLCLFFFRSQLMMLHKTFHSSRLFQCPDVGRRRLHFWPKCSLLVQRVHCVNAVQFSSDQCRKISSDQNRKECLMISPTTWCSCLQNFKLSQFISNSSFH